MSSSDGLGVLIGFSVLVGLIWGILKSRNKKPKIITSKAINDDKEIAELSREDSEFDGEMLFDDPLFPPENFDDEDD